MREDRQRLDKWLWFARFAKTRALAASLVADGHVRLNGGRVENAARGVAVGDVLTVAVARTTAVVRIEGLGVRRGPSPDARTLYRDLGRDDPTLVTPSGKG